MPKFNVTYEIVTPESAAYGDAEDRGFVANDVSLREAVSEIGGYAMEADHSPFDRDHPPRWFTNCGAEESRTMHLPKTITPSSALRIARLLGVS